MSSIPFIGRSALLAFCLASIVTPRPACLASSVTVAAAEYNGLSQDGGTELAVGNQVRVGFFDLSDAQIEANQSNLPFLLANFAEIGRVSIGTSVGGAAGHFQSEPLIGNATQLRVANKQIYIWVLKTAANGAPNASLSDVTEHGIFYVPKETTNFDNWRIRPDAEIPNSTHVELAELTDHSNNLIADAKVVVGQFPSGASTANPGASNFALEGVGAVGAIPTVVAVDPLDITVNSGKIRGTVTPTGPGTTVEFFVEGQTTKVVVLNPGTTPEVLSVNFTGLAPHTSYQAFIRATNMHGSAQSAKFLLTTANSTPEAGNTTINLASNGPTATIDLSTLVTDADGAENFSFQVGTASGGAVTIDGTTATFTQNANSAQTSFTYVANDGFGGTDTGTVTINDITNPTLNVAAIPTAGYSARQRLTANFVPVAAYGDNSGFATVTLNPPIGSLLSFGQQDITVTITDPKGNHVSQAVSVTAGVEIATAETAAKKGGEVGNAIPGATWFSFGYPAINNDRQLAFTALLGISSGASVSKADDSALFILNENDDATLIAREGKVEPVSGALWMSFTDPVLNNSGHVAFAGKLKAKTGDATTANDDVIYSTTGGTPHIVAREGGDAQVGGPVFASFLGLVQPDIDRVIFLAKLKKGAAGSPAVSGGNDVGIWIESGTGGLIKMVREGDTLTTAYNDGGPITTLEFLPRVTQMSGQSRSFTEDGTIIFRAKFTNKRTGIFTCKLVAGVPTFTKVAVDTEAVASEPASATWKLFGQPMIDSGGTGAFQATLTIAGSVTKDNDLGLFAENDPQYLFPFVREGDLDDDLPANTQGKFIKFSEILSPVPGSLAFFGTLKADATIKSTADTGFWAKLPGESLKLIAREGAVAADTNGPVFSAFTSLAFPPDKRPILFAKIKTGAKGTTAVKPTDDVGIWAMNSEGTLKLAIREGMTPDGVNSPITILSAFPAPLMVHGQARDYNQNGDLTFRATLKDSSTAIFRILR